LIKIAKCVYDKPDSSDGTRVLVMRMWPRGISKDKVDVWLKDLGTERELIRKWKSGRVSWEEYENEYLKSLKGKEETLLKLAAESEKGAISLLCTERDPSHCHRSLLKSAIEQLRTANDDGT